MNVKKVPWAPLQRYPDPTAGGDIAQGGGKGGGVDEETDGHDDAGSSEPDAGSSKRIKVTKTGGSSSGDVQMADVSEHQDQRDGAFHELRAALRAEAAAIEPHMLEGIVGCGCTGYVFSLRCVNWP